MAFPASKSPEMTARDAKPVPTAAMPGYLVGREVCVLQLIRQSDFSSPKREPTSALLTTPWSNSFAFAPESHRDSIQLR